MTLYSYTPGEARDAIYATFWTLWDDSMLGWRSVLPGTLSDAPTAPLVVWDAEEPEDDAPITAPTVYAYVRHTTGDQASLRGENGRRWRRKGFGLFRLHVPSGLPLKTGDGLAKVIVNAFQGKRGVGSGAGITFPSVRPVEQGSVKNRFKIDVIAGFEYDELI